MATETMLTDRVDELGFLLAQIADLEKQAAAIKAELISAGVPVCEGDLFRATVVEQVRKTTDYKTLVAVLDIPSSWVEEHTTAKAVTSVRVTSR